MKRLLVMLALAAAGASHAQVQSSLFESGDTCYSWNGGHKSAGSFSKCNPPTIVVVAPPPPPVVVQQAAPAPQIMQSCPPPERPPIVRPHKPRPKVICKPAP